MAVIVNARQLVRLARVAVAGLAALAVGSAMAGVQIQSPVLFASEASFVDHVRKECGIDRVLSDYMLKEAQEKIADVKTATEVTRVAAEPYVRITVTNVIGVGGGGWSGPKIMSIRADLLENGRIVASKSFRDSGRGGPFSGTCRILTNLAENLANDMTDWLIEVADVDVSPARLAKGAGTRKHAKPVPAASGFAAATEVKAVPVSEAGKARYQHYLSLPAPKAFAIAEDGLWRIVANDAKAVPRVLEACVSRGYACSLYAVDDQVVWHEDAAKRVSLPAPSNAAELRNPAAGVKPAAPAASDNGSQ
ncbi:hypothetical protein [Piscinibacter gummiphilus]|uniref:Uncharacterized protein n=1 Tax=Piscinibacter gummiphilus TaxID=946333 RepID=A0ABZ0CVT9_9BURK|nr:hypothetical protein [Piscinibacter gummiphilus]WOB09091.1 hypothetical protein RXV79_03310 [Piscinibacter gummiphilus]